MRVRACWAALLLVIGVLQLGPAYRGLATPIALIAAVIVPFSLVWAGHALRVAAGVVASGCAIAALALGWWLVQGSGRGWDDALPELLTTPRPAPATAALLAPSVVLAALVACAVAGCVFSTGRGERVPGMFAPLVGAVLLYVAGQLLDGGGADPHGIAAMGIVVVTAAAWSLPGARGAAATSSGAGLQRGYVLRPAIVAPVVLAAGVGLVAALIAPATSAFEPRRHVSTPVIQLEQPNPLGLLASWAQHPNTEILRAQLHGTRRLHLATLAEFAGDRWVASGRYQHLGTAAGPALPAGPQQPVRASVQIVRLGGLWLPVPGRTSASSLPDTLVNADSATVARVEQVHPGLAYTVRGSIDAADSDALAAASVPANVPARYLALPHLPSSFATYAREAVRGASTPLEEAIALEHAVATGRTRSAQAPTGSSYARLETFLFRPAGSTPGARVGTSEQFAASFAILARAVGLPTRIVVGFVAEAPGANGVSVVRGRDALAWPEVYLDGAGWVPFAPTPGSPGGSGKQDLRQSVLTRLAGQASSVPPSPPAPSAPSGSGTVPAPTHSAAAATAEHPSRTGLMALAAALLVLLLIVVLLAGLRRVRTARHRGGGAQGAWSETLDLALLLGTRPARSAPAPEIAHRLDRDLAAPGPLAHTVAVAAERAAFGPTGSDVPTVWGAVRTLRRRARAQLPWWRRALFGIDPRPILQRRH